MATRPASSALVFLSLFPVLPLMNEGPMPMNKIIFLLLPASLLFISCNSSVNKIFDKKTAHEVYGSKIDDSPEGLQWVAVSKTVLASPQIITLPYRQFGYFPTNKARALSLGFNARPGERINFELAKKPGSDFVVYADLFKQEGTEASHLMAADTAIANFGWDILTAGFYILRLQPELIRSGDYELSISVGPSLGFPVTGSKARIGSFWGDNRDAGLRSHEGIDIFAPKLTPALAATDGYITRVAEGGIGGKTVWLRPSGQDINLYYAHLDQQLVEEGQAIKKGDTLGLIGNTGNAKFTPPHLHFGIYTFNGAVDPLPFVNKRVKTAPAFKAKTLTARLQFKPTRKTRAAELPVIIDSLLIPLAVSADNYIAEFPDGRVIQTPIRSVKTIRVQKQPDNLATGKLENQKTNG
jgi:murein DD-endopeptidase MepM/ murein hydrolase activator NlpD